MAQASSAQREPSMEEILASIRRIIEDSDSTSTETFEAATDDRSTAPPSPPEMASDQGAGAEIVEVDSFRAEFEPDVDEPEEENDEDLPAPARLADIQAEVEARAAEMDETERAQHASSSTSSEQPADAYDEATDPATAQTPPAEADKAFGWPVNAVNDPQAEHSDDPETGAQHAAADAHRDPAPAILSEMSGRRVAAAFDELSDAFDVSRRRNFDEMAEEMLRPMLQDWLDNNLPTLVEKLVREEIERVARGAAR